MAVEISGTTGVDQSQVTGATQLPVGTTSERPASPQAGMMRFNTDTGQVEGWNPNTELWVALSEEFFVPIVATGGTVTDITQDGKEYRVHTFTSSGTFEVTRGGDVEYLVVGGGGAGSGSDGGRCGSGGAGGYRSSVRDELSGENSLAEDLLVVSAQTYVVTVGNGGTPVENGEDSSFAGVVSIGGGRGGHPSRDSSALSGGSGGGGPRNGSGAAGTPNQGFGGGNGAGGVNINSAGGGGAGEAGQNSPSQTAGGKGGDGLPSSITGELTFYAGGGGGRGGSGPNGQPGLGGGGVGSGGDGVPNTGGGGGGGFNNSGGSGIVIVRYRIG